MTEVKVAHATIVVERSFANIPRAEVFAAWADVEQRKQWDLPGGDDWVVAELAQDFRVGGRERSRFGPASDPRYWSEGEFLDIVTDQRIISAGVMHDGPTPTSATLCTLELIALGTGSKLILTDQSAFFGGERPSDREAGWGKILDRLAKYLSRR